MIGPLIGDGEVLPGPGDFALLYERAMPQKDQLCGAFWGALVLSASGRPTSQEEVALRAGTTLAGGDPAGWLPPGAAPRNDYSATIPTAPDAASAGTSATGVARGVEELSGGALSVVPVAGPWTAASVVSLVEISALAPGCVPIANLRTGRLWGSRPPARLLLEYLIGRPVGAPPPDWDCGHFLTIAASVRGAANSLIVLRDTYPQLGWDGHHLQPVGAVAAALERGDGLEGGVLCVCQARMAGDLTARLQEAGFELRHWDNGSPGGEGAARTVGDFVGDLLRSLEDELPGAAKLREHLHANPEPSHEERTTAGLVAEALGEHDVERVAGTGLVAQVGPPGDAVAVRAELDALPIEEETGASFAAANGFMHACGHDVHMAALSALFRAADGIGGSLPKPLIALYQPSEETYPAGADLIVKEGVLTGGTSAVVAAHVHPDVPWGAVSVEAGPVNASCDYLRIVVEGSGGHGAYPHRARDPVVALSHVVVALQSLVSRRMDPMRAAVCSIGRLRAGTAENVIPGVAEAGGTLRALDPRDREPLREMAREIVASTARAHGCVARMEVTEGEPATVNDPALAEAARSLLPAAGFELAPAMRSCGSDDFGFYGRLAPTLMLFVGLKGAPNDPDVPLHHPRFLPPAEAVGAVARAQAMAFVAAASSPDRRRDVV